MSAASSRFFRQMCDRDVGALPGEGDGDSTADAGVASRDERPPSDQTTNTDVAVLAVIRPWCQLLGGTRMIDLLFRDVHAR